MKCPQCGGKLAPETIRRVSYKYNDSQVILYLKARYCSPCKSLIFNKKEGDMLNLMISRIANGLH